MARVSTTLSHGVDAIQEKEGRFGLGFMLPIERVPRPGPARSAMTASAGRSRSGTRRSASPSVTTDLISPQRGADPSTPGLVATLLEYLG